MFGKMGDMLGKLNEIKQQAEEAKARLEILTEQVSGANGDIKITITGSRKIKELSVSQSLQNASKEELEKELLATFNKAIDAANKLSAEEMKKVAGGLIPPGLL